MAYATGTNQPIGLKPGPTLTSSTNTGQQNQYNIASGYGVSLFAGDRVVVANGEITIALPGTPATGVFQQVQYTDTFGNPVIQTYWLAGTVTQGAVDASAYIVDDVNVLFDVQVSNSLNVANPSILQNMMGLNANLSLGGGGGNISPQNPTSGNVRTGLSGYYLDFSTISSDSTLDVKLIRFTPVAGNIADVPYNNVLVKLNNVAYSGTGVGNNIDSLKIVTLVAPATTYTALLSDEIIDSYASTANAMAITIPTAAASNKGKQYIIKDAGGHASTGGRNITIAPVAGNIDGATPLTINADYGHARIVSDGTAWFTI